jgi:hypothetical protein
MAAAVERSGTNGGSGRDDHGNAAVAGLALEIWREHVLVSDDRGCQQRPTEPMRESR